MSWQRLRPPAAPLNWPDLLVELDESVDFACPCCGHPSRAVWGRVSDTTGALATYKIEWTLRDRLHGAHFDLIIGDWDEAATRDNRAGVSLVYRAETERSGFMLLDARDRWSEHRAGIASTTLARTDIEATPVADEVYAIVDAVWMRDGRIDEIRGWQPSA